MTEKVKDSKFKVGDLLFETYFSRNAAVDDDGTKYRTDDIFIVIGPSLRKGSNRLSGYYTVYEVGRMVFSEISENYLTECTIRAAE